jgi:hypothetical protein
MNIKNNIMKAKMLTKISGFLFLSILSFGNLLSQTTTPATQTSTVAPHNVGTNSTHVYDVDYTVRGAISNQYTWTIYTANVAYVKEALAVQATHYTITAGANAAIQSIAWLVAGHYVIELQEANPATKGSCAGTLQSLNVNVGPTGSVQFQNAAGTNQCAAAGGYSLTLSYTGTISYPINVDVQYTINTVTSNATIAVANALATLDIPLVVNFLASAVDDAARSVKITGARDSFGGTLTIGATDTHTLTIWSLPATSPIHHD